MGHRYARRAPPSGSAALPAGGSLPQLPAPARPAVRGALTPPPRALPRAGPAGPALGARAGLAWRGGVPGSGAVAGSATLASRPKEGRWRRGGVGVQACPSQPVRESACPSQPVRVSLSESACPRVSLSESACPSQPVRVSLSESACPKGCLAACSAVAEGSRGASGADPAMAPPALAWPPRQGGRDGSAVVEQGERVRAAAGQALGASPAGWVSSRRHILTITAVHNLTITADHNLTITAVHNLTITADHNLTITADHNLTITAVAR
jgi:hypothetical protein